MIGQICTDNTFKKLINKYNELADITSQQHIEKFLNKAILQSINTLGSNYTNKFFFDFYIQIDGKYLIKVHWGPETNNLTYIYGVDNNSFLGTNAVISNFYTVQHNTNINTKYDYNIAFYNLNIFLFSKLHSTNIIAYRIPNNNLNDIYVYLYSDIVLYYLSVDYLNNSVRLAQGGYIRANNQSTMLLNVFGNIFGSNKFKKLFNKYNEKPNLQIENSIKNYINKGTLHSILNFGSEYKPRELSIYHSGDPPYYTYQYLNAFVFSMIIKINNVSKIYMNWDNPDPSLQITEGNYIFEPKNIDN